MIRTPTYTAAPATSSAMVTLGLSFAADEHFVAIDDLHDSVGLRPALESSGKKRAKRTEGPKKIYRDDSDSKAYGSPPRIRKKLHRSVGLYGSEDDDDDDDDDGDEELCAHNHLDSSTEDSVKTSVEEHEDEDTPITPTPMPQIIVTDVDRIPTSTQEAIDYLIAIKPDPGSESCPCAQGPFIASRLASVAMALARAGHVKQAWVLGQFGANVLGADGDGHEI
ncbi:hypothetical protein B0A48_12744 [Cryoendolithus antarcticus]|uniref:Uncharacterized protein n=1 Tax=Cryoendolithus antarcticus TaxID=1507870 RepID=A0A1V8SR99_9PEZI|nr:hypothetical protein B0A48_12744 [Cryoendolithus antarcticus]